MKRLRLDLDRILERDLESSILLSLQGGLADIGDILLNLRAMQAFDRGAMRYAIQRTVRCASRRPIEDLFDDLALNTGFAAPRLSSTSLLLDGPGVFISAEGRRKIGTDPARSRFGQ